MSDSRRLLGEYKRKKEAMDRWRLYAALLREAELTKVMGVDLEYRRRRGWIVWLCFYRPLSELPADTLMDLQLRAMEIIYARA